MSPKWGVFGSKVARSKSKRRPPSITAALALASSTSSFSTIPPSGSGGACLIEFETSSETIKTKLSRSVGCRLSVTASLAIDRASGTESLSCGNRCSGKMQICPLAAADTQTFPVVAGTKPERD
jgi:hypothetical protein